MANSHKNVTAADAHAPAAHTASHQAGGSDALTGAIAATTIELGHASDTTIARVSAGVVAIEGTNIVKAGAITTSGLTQATARLIGRSTASTGAPEEITLGTNLSFTGTTLNAAGGGAAAVATDTIWDAAGDLVQGTGADTGAKLSAGLTGKVLQAAGATTAVAWKYPPGYEFDYVEITAAVNSTATSAATATTCITGNAITYDGSTIVLIEFFAPYLTTVAASAAASLIQLYDGATDLGSMIHITNHASASILRMGVFAAHRLTPSAAAHTYTIRLWTTNAGTTTLGAGAAGGGYMPAFIRQTKVSGGA